MRALECMMTSVVKAPLVLLGLSEDEAKDTATEFTRVAIASANQQEGPAILAELLVERHALCARIPNLILRVIGECADGKIGKLLEKAATDRLGDLLIHHGVDEGRSRKVVALINNLSSRVGAAAKATMLQPNELARELVRLSKLDETNAALLLSCALDIIGQSVVQQVRARGFDGERVELVVREVVGALPNEKVAATLLRGPDQLVEEVLRLAAERGEAVAEEMLEDALEYGKDMAMGKLIGIGVSPEYAEHIAESTLEYLQSGEAITQAQEVLSGGASAKEVMQQLK